MVVSDLDIGESRTIQSLRFKGTLKRRFMDMGIIPGETIKLLSTAPFGDPLTVLVKRYQLSLRRDEAQLIDVF